MHIIHRVRSKRHLGQMAVCILNFICYNWACFNEAKDKAWFIWGNNPMRFFFEEELINLYPVSLGEQNGDLFMNNISLSISSGSNSTVISNRFIDVYMPKASGSYVKVYIYLLRCLSDPASNMSLSYIADKLDETEKDINRALAYWEKNSVIAIKRDSFQRITDITLLNLERNKQAEAEEPAPEIVEEEPFYVKEVFATTTSPQPRPTYSDSQITQLLEVDEVKWLLQMLEQRLKRLLKPADLQLVLYFFEGLGFSADLILHLYDYCLDKNKKNNSYIEAVALAWAEDGIDSISKAEAASASYNQNFTTVFRAFGLNRAPAPVEQQLMKRWFETFGFGSDIVTEACNRTMLAINKPDFKYADKILENWYTKGVKQMDDVVVNDSEHSKSASQTSGSQRSNITRPFQNNKFNLFPQRRYTEEEYSSMEQRLLNKQQG